MRRLLVTAALGAAILLFAAPAALAVSAPLHAAGHSGASARAPFAKDRMARAPLTFEPLARRILTGSGTIALNVYTFNGMPEVGAEVGWWVVEELDFGTGSGSTDDNGHVDLTGVPAATAANGEIAVFLNHPDNGMYDLSNLGWGASGWSGGLQPGRLPLTIVRSSQSGWTGWTAARAWLWAENPGAERHLARTDIAQTGATTNGYARTITTGPESLTGGALYFWDNQGLELPVGGIAVSSGQEAEPGQTVYQAQAQRLWMDGWGSGKPGTRTWLGLNNYPSGWVNSVGGVADWPSSASPKDFGSFTTTGNAADDWKRITIPSGAAPGYAYYVWADHDDGPLSLTTWFQVCTLKPSRATVGKSTAVGLSGVVPIKGHEGSTRGTPKWVHLYKTTSSRLAAKGQPPVNGGGARAAGWTRIGRVRTDGLGKYRKGSISPGRTTWYVAWYPRDSWYWGAWTSVAKVTVR